VLECTSGAQPQYIDCVLTVHQPFAHKATVTAAKLTKNLATLKAQLGKAPCFDCGR
jgi:hypothetical protein